MDSKIEMARRIVNSNSNYEQGLERGQINFTAQEVMKIALAAIEECTERAAKAADANGFTMLAIQYRRGDHLKGPTDA